MTAPPALKAKLIFVACLALIVGMGCGKYATSLDVRIWQRVLAGILGVLSLLLSLISIWLTTYRLSTTNTLLTLYFHSALVGAVNVNRQRKVRRFEDSWKNPRKAQESLLKDAIKLNGHTVYGKEFGIASISSLKELRERHSLTTYERYRPYVDRMAKGEVGVLTSEIPARFSLTSGTTGNAKMFPYIKSYYSKLMSEFMGLQADIGRKMIGHNAILQRMMNLYTAPKLRYTEGGTLMGPASMIPSWMKPFLVIFTSPPAAFDIHDPHDAVYVHLLFGLRDRNLGIIYANFTSNMMSAMRLLEQCWPDIVRDIERGTVSSKAIPPETLRALKKAMGRGDPVRAAELKKEFEKGFDGIVKRVWPHITQVQAMDSVGLKDVLLTSYLKGVLLYGQVLGATEGVIGCNITPSVQGKDEFVLLPSFTVYEFIPEDKIHEDQPETLFIDELQEGGVYEVVLTQMFGVYRYRYGDVIRVTRYHEHTPIVQFMYRAGQILNVHSEKLDQQIVQKCIEAAIGQWPGFDLRDYAVAESTLLDQLVTSGSEHRPYYIVFIELEQKPDPRLLNQAQLRKVDEELRLSSFTYNSFREKGSIAPPVVHIVEGGTFARLHDFILENSTTTANQYKVPRKLRTTQTLQLMLDSSLFKLDLTSTPAS